MGGYIKHSDLAKILRRLEEKQGRAVMYDKDSLQDAIDELVEYSKPKYTIDERNKILDCIDKYRNNALDRKCKPYLYRFLESAMNIDNIEGYYIAYKRNYKEITYKDAINIIPTSKMLGELLQVSKPTLARWGKEKIITQYLHQPIEVFSIVNERQWNREYKTEKSMYNLVDLVDYIKSMNE